MTSFSGTWRSLPRRNFLLGMISTSSKSQRSLEVSRLALLALVQQGACASAPYMLRLLRGH